MNIGIIVYSWSGNTLSVAESSEAASSAEQRQTEPTGILVPSGDAEALAAGIHRLLTDDGLRRALSGNATVDARRRFDLEYEADAYLGWYRELIRPGTGEVQSVRPPLGTVAGV